MGARGCLFALPGGEGERTLGLEHYTRAKTGKPQAQVNPLMKDS
jgi:hypothetical protein